MSATIYQAIIAALVTMDSIWPMMATTVLVSSAQRLSFVCLCVRLCGSWGGGCLRWLQALLNAVLWLNTQVHHLILKRCDSTRTVCDRSPLLRQRLVNTVALTHALLQMWMSASSTTAAASTRASTPWAATSVAARRASSSVTTSTRASTALWVSDAPCPHRSFKTSSVSNATFFEDFLKWFLFHLSITRLSQCYWHPLSEIDATSTGDRFKLTPVTELFICGSHMLWEKELSVPENKIS